MHFFYPNIIISLIELYKIIKGKINERINWTPNFPEKLSEEFKKAFNKAKTLINKNPKESAILLKQLLIKLIENTEIDKLPLIAQKALSSLRIIGDNANRFEELVNDNPVEITLSLMDLVVFICEEN